MIENYRQNSREYRLKEDTKRDRRSGRDRRHMYDLDYFLDGGVVRRHFRDRRSSCEKAN